MIGDQTRLTRQDSALFTTVEDSVLMMDIDSGAYYELDGTAAKIWHALEKPATFGELCAGLKRRFDVDAERCRDETSHFIGELLRLSLVKAD
jgi:hypothetical protein